MKVIFSALIFTFSFSAFASYHFECHKKIGHGRFESSPSELLVPNLGDLTSGGALVSTNESKADREFQFLRSDSLVSHGGWITMEGSQGEILKIQKSGMVRKMKIINTKKALHVVEDAYKCFIESSI